MWNLPWYYGILSNRHFKNKIKIKSLGNNQATIGSEESSSKLGGSTSTYLSNHVSMSHCNSLAKLGLAFQNHGHNTQG